MGLVGSLDVVEKVETDSGYVLGARVMGIGRFV